MLATPTKGVTTTRTTTPSFTWSHLQIVRHMLMLKTKAIAKNILGVIFGTTQGTTNMEEGIRSVTTMRMSTLTINNDNLVMSVNNNTNGLQVKKVSNNNANPIIWLAMEDLLLTTIMSEKKPCVPTEETWRMKKTPMESSNSTCPSSKAKMMPKLILHGHSKLTKSSASTTTPVRRR
jgi:hypothetical protein